MKKIMFVTPVRNGHYLPYFKSLEEIVTKELDAELVAVVPTECSEIKCRQIVVPEYTQIGGFTKYLRSMRNLERVAKEENPDCIHILYGDFLYTEVWFYRYFGIGLKKLKKYHLIMTFHQIIRIPPIRRIPKIVRSKLRDISLKRIFSVIDFGVVHTASLKKMLEDELHVQNAVHIEYPRFQEGVAYDIPNAKWVDEINLAKEPILLALGGTRFDKGLDILLDALKCVKHPFHLLIAGREQTISGETIYQKIETYKDNVTIHFAYLTDSEFEFCLQKADFIILPYRKIFNGASGPLAEGVALGKTIIGPNHGSLGDIISSNHLGYTFEVENTESLAATIDRALQSDFKYDDTALKYKDSLNPQIFQRKYLELYRIAMNKK